MAQYIKPVYKGEAKATYDDVLERLNEKYFVTNKFYRLNKRTYFKVSSAGRLHLYKLQRGIINGKPYYYLNDYILTTDNYYQDRGRYTRLHDTIEEIEDFINRGNIARMTIQEVID